MGAFYDVCVLDGCFLELQYVCDVYADLLSLCKCTCECKENQQTVEIFYRC